MEVDEPIRLLTLKKPQELAEILMELVLGLSNFFTKR
jgi:hypothetical protein